VTAKEVAPGSGLKSFLWESKDLAAVIAVSPFLLFSDWYPRFVSVGGALLLAIFCMLRWFSNPCRYLVVTALLFPFIVLSLVSLSISINLDKSLNCLYFLELGCALFLLIGGQRDLPGWIARTWTHLFIAGVLLLGLTGPVVAEFRVPRKFLDLAIPKMRAPGVGEILDANILGCLLAIALALAIGFLIQSPADPQERRPRRLASVWSLLLAILLLVTQSRSALFGIFSAVLVMVALRWRRNRTIALSVFGIAGVFLWWRDIDFFREIAGRMGAADALTFRLEIWERARYAVQDFPFTGIGAGTFQEAVLHLYPLVKLSPDAAPYHSHNLYMQLSLDLGIGGLVAFFTLASFCFIAGLDCFRSGKGLALGYLGAVVVVLMVGLLDSPLWMNKPNAVIFFLFGMLATFHFSQDPVAYARQPAKNVSLFDVLFLIALWLLLTLVSIVLLSWHFEIAMTLAIGSGFFLGWEWYRLTDDRLGEQPLCRSNRVQRKEI